MELAEQHYNISKGWEDTHPKWFSYRLKMDETNYNLHYDIVSWLYDHIDNCEKHARWMANRNSVCVKFRYERDYNWFVLRWA